jgi:predicted adenine nucleotide alpha hydrolase (AANH) superfamily ATPase
MASMILFAARKKLPGISCKNCFSTRLNSSAEISKNARTPAFIGLLAFILQMNALAPLLL